MRLINKLKRNKASIALNICAALLLCVTVFIYLIQIPADWENRLISVEVPHGASVTYIAKMLAEAGLIKNESAFKLLARIKKCHPRDKGRRV